MSRIGATSALLTVVFISAPFIAAAETTASGGATQTTAASVSGSPDLNTLIQSLLSQIKALQQKLAALQASVVASSTPSQTSSGDNTGSGWAHACATFQRNLSVGSQGTDVSDLQQLLADNDLMPSNNVTGHFGPITVAALSKFQEQFGITPSSVSGGTFGPMTRQFLKKKCDRPIPPTTCMKRPACLDATPRCMIAEPIDGWCPDHSKTVGLGQHCGGFINNAPVCATGLHCQLSLIADIGGTCVADIPSGTSTPACGAIQCFRYDPVCGSDGKTYTCGEADASSCGVRVAYKGACSVSTTTPPCIPRPACLDATPRCLPPEPAGGWCPSTTTSPVIACTADAMKCPDGSYVGRTGPNCLFVCPTTSNPVTTDTSPAPACSCIPNSTSNCTCSSASQCISPQTHVWCIANTRATSNPAYCSLPVC